MTFLAGPARHRRPTLFGRSALGGTALTLALGMLVLSGCSTTTPAAPAPSATSVPSSEPAPEPEPTDDPDTGGTPPDQAFDGDCSLVFSTASISDVAGWPAAEPIAFVGTTPDLALVRQVGGVGCVWGPAEGTEGYLQVTVVPQKKLSGQLEDGTTCFLQLEKTYICAIDLEANGYHLSANYTTANTSSYRKANAVSDRLAETFTANAEAREKAVSPKAPKGAWPLDFTCAELGKNAKIGKALDNPDLKISDGGGDVQVTAAETDLWGGRPFLRCYWSQDAADGSIPQVTVAVLGGAAWAQQRLAVMPGAEEVDVEGAERAIIVTDPNGEGSPTGDLHIFDGVNWFVISADGIEPQALFPAVPVLLEGLDEL